MKKSEDATTFGSFIYRMQQFGADIDGIQRINYQDENTTIRTFIRTLKSVLRNLDKTHIYSEIKAGLDYNYLFPVGKLHNGIFSIDDNLINVLNKRYKNNRFDSQEYHTMMKAIDIVKNSNDKSIHSMAYDYIFDVIRNRTILRWSKEEILKSQKNNRWRNTHISQCIEGSYNG